MLWLFGNRRGEASSAASTAASKLEEIILLLIYILTCNSNLENECGDSFFYICLNPSVSLFYYMHIALLQEED